MASCAAGGCRAEAMAADGTLRVSRAACAILTEVFPVRPHFRYLVDHF